MFVILNVYTKSLIVKSLYLCVFLCSAAKKKEAGIFKLSCHFRIAKMSQSPLELIQRMSHCFVTLSARVRADSAAKNEVLVKTLKLSNVLLPYEQRLKVFRLTLWSWSPC